MTSGVLDNNFVEGGAQLRGISLVQAAFSNVAGAIASEKVTSMASI